MSQTPGVVIVGAGHAGFQTAKSLRDRGYDKSVTLIDSHEIAPYQRPPLSKAYLQGSAEASDLHFAGDEYYAEASIEVMRGVSAERIDRAAKQLHLSSGDAIEYEHLVLATGAKSRELTVPGADAKGVYMLRTLADADDIAAHMQSSTKVVVIGAGFIGLEFVAAALARGFKPTVLEFANRVMGRVVSETVSAYFNDHYTEQGANILLGRGVASIEAKDGRVVAVLDTDGVRHEADLVVAGIGVMPETRLAEEAGLKVDNGIVVDGLLTTSDPHISALGDCCHYPSVTAGQMVRLESVQNATDHGRCVALKLTGKPAEYKEIPWFWSDQGAKKLQIAGLNFGFDEEVVRGDVASGQFSVFLYQQGKLVAVDSVDRPMDHMNVRRLMMADRSIEPADAANLDFDLKAFARMPSK